MRLGQDPPLPSPIPKFQPRGIGHVESRPQENFETQGPPPHYIVNATPSFSKAYRLHHHLGQTYVNTCRGSTSEIHTPCLQLIPPNIRCWVGRYKESIPGYYFRRIYHIHQLTTYHKNLKFFFFFNKFLRVKTRCGHT